MSKPEDEVQRVLEDAGFEKELTSLINKYSMENTSDTPDFILSQYIEGCLVVFNRAVLQRDQWYKDDAEAQGIGREQLGLWSS